MRRVLFLVVPLCAALLAQGAWYWPFGSKEDDPSQPLRLHRLLEEANNALVRQAKAEGGTAVGYTCYYLPEVLLNCGRAFSVRLRAPNTGSPAVAFPT